MFKKLLSMALVMSSVTSVAMADDVLRMETISIINNGYMFSGMQEKVMTSGMFEENLNSSICELSEKEMPRVASKEDFKQMETLKTLCDEESVCPTCVPTSWFSKIGSCFTKAIGFVVSTIKSLFVK